MAKELHADKEVTCCFSGHRRLPEEKMIGLIQRLNEKIDHLLLQGVQHFLVGGALGFDYIATLAIKNKREANKNIRLIFALPCPNYNQNWPHKAKLLYKELILSQADEVIYISDTYSRDCFRKRNYFMVEHSQYCICALLHSRTGTGQTVRMAKANGLTVINLLEDSGSDGGG